jgi:hypothetical protein
MARSFSNASLLTYVVLPLKSDPTVVKVLEVDQRSTMIAELTTCE